MPTDFSHTLVVGISATALFDLSEEDGLFKTLHERDPDEAIEGYRRYMVEREDRPLAVGTGYPLVSALLGLNQYRKHDEPPLVEVIVLSRNSPDTGIRVLKTIRDLKLGVSRSAFTGGESVTDYLDAFDVDLFLTTNEEDGQRVADADQCPVSVLRPPPQDMPAPPSDQVRIAFDGDAVLFSEESEIVNKTQGLAAFHVHEDQAKDTPLADGPFASFIKKLALLQERLPFRVEHSPIRIAIVTARNAPAEMRVIHTLRHWGVYVDEAFFLGGVEKTKILKAFRPHIFFDDQDVHLDRAASVVPSSKVPYKSDSQLGARTKVCARCEKRLPLSDFHKHAASSDGRQGYCKTCNIDRQYEAGGAAVAHKSSSD